MIEIILFVGAVLVIFVVWICCGQVDNTYCLEFKESVEKRFQRYMPNRNKYGDNLEQGVGRWWSQVGKCCEEIAACDRIWDGKRGLIYEQQLTPLLDELKELGFFEKTKRKQPRQKNEIQIWKFGLLDSSEFLKRI